MAKPEYQKQRNLSARLFGLTLAAATFLPVAGARAQNSAADYRQQLDRLRREQLLQASPNVSAGQRAYFDYGAYLTFTYLTVDDQFHDSHALRQTDFVAYSRLNFDNAHEVLLRVRTGYRDFNNGDSFDGRGDEPIDGDLDIGYYKFDLARYLGAYQGKEIDGDLTVKIGRDIVYWGNGLAMAQVIDGAMVDLVKGPLQVSAIAGVTPVRTVDFDGSRPDFDFNTRRGFYGAMASTGIGEHRPFAYALLQQDYNKDEVLSEGSVKTHFGYDSYYLGLGSTGTLGDRVIYGAEMVYEGGQGLSNSFSQSGPFITQVPQTRDEIQAFAADLRADYLVPDPRHTRVGGEFLLATGDNDRLRSTSNTFAGNLPNTNDRAFNGFGLINTGQAFAPAVSNLIALRGGISTYPFSDIRTLQRMQVGMDVFLYSKFLGDAPVDEATAAGRSYLGWEPDFFVNWQVTSDITLALRYGVFFPSSRAFEDSDPRQFFSTSVTFAF
ncbi:MAG TPA: alginate export family protein [Tepidisphaeraceae bacterium]|nr:alginate export family protein [Tepidisphaeraceae bacterium]